MIIKNLILFIKLIYICIYYKYLVIFKNKIKVNLSSVN